MFVTLFILLMLFKSLIISNRDVMINVIITVGQCHKGNGLPHQQLRREKTTLELEMKVESKRRVCPNHQLKLWKTKTHEISWEWNGVTSKFRGVDPVDRYPP